MRHEVGFAAPDAHRHLVTALAPFGLHSLLLLPSPPAPGAHSETSQDTFSVRYKNPSTAVNAERNGDVLETEIREEEEASWAQGVMPYGAADAEVQAELPPPPMSYEEAVSAAPDYDSCLGGAPYHENPSDSLYPDFT